LAVFRPLFLEVLRLAGEMGMVKLGNLSTDGTKMEANASRHKAMSYGYRKSGVSPSFLPCQKSGVSPSFLPEKMRKDEPTPDYAPRQR
jgi:hypothetical protein